MIVPRIEEYWLYSNEHDAAWEDEQVDPRNFSAVFGYCVAFDGAGDAAPVDYEVRIVSGAWLASRQLPGTIWDGRHALVLLEYDEHVIVSYLENQLAASAGDDLAAVLGALDAVGRATPRRTDGSIR